MLHFKDEVIVGSPIPEIIQAIYIVATCYNGYDCWITSMADGLHKGKPVDESGKDPHYVGKAVDFRIWNIPRPERAILIGKIVAQLSLPYVVLWEAKNTANEHLHVQYGKILK